MSNFLMKWKRYKDNHSFLSYLILFSFLFLITIILFFSSFFIHHKSMIWTGSTKDGLVQHYNALMYFGRYLRSILYNLFINHQLSIPMWDFSIGYGGDILASLHYYVIGDPLNLLSVFVSSKYTEYLYMFLIIFRLYLSGVSFSYYCFQWQKDTKSLLVGAFTYVFCGYVIFASVRHPYFINPMIYLPLLLLGSEKILHNQSSKLFIIILAISAISNFYFLYMLCLMVFIYVLIRFISLYRLKIKFIIHYFFKFLISAIVGLCIAAVILMPVIAFFFQTARSEYKIAFDPIYSLNYYLSCFFNFNSYNFADYWTIFGYNSVSLLCIFLMFIYTAKLIVSCQTQRDNDNNSFPARTTENISVGYSLSISSKERPEHSAMTSSGMPLRFMARAISSLPCSIPFLIPFSSAYSTVFL